MTEPLQSGDLAMFVRDTMLHPLDPCHGAMIGTPVVLASRDEIAARLTGRESWLVKGRLRCPRCKNLNDVFFASDLHKLPPASTAARIETATESEAHA